MDAIFDALGINPRKKLTAKQTELIDLHYRTLKVETSIKDQFAIMILHHFNNEVTYDWGHYEDILVKLKMYKLNDEHKDSVDKVTYFVLPEIDPLAKEDDAQSSASTIVVEEKKGKEEQSGPVVSEEEIDKSLAALRALDLSVLDAEEDTYTNLRLSDTVVVPAAADATTATETALEADSESEWETDSGTSSMQESESGGELSFSDLEKKAIQMLKDIGQPFDYALAKELSSNGPDRVAKTFMVSVAGKAVSFKINGTTEHKAAYAVIYGMKGFEDEVKEAPAVLEDKDDAEKKKVVRKTPEFAEILALKKALLTLLQYHKKVKPSGQKKAHVPFDMIIILTDSAWLAETMTFSIWKWHANGGLSASKKPVENFAAIDEVHGLMYGIAKDWGVDIKFWKIEKEHNTAQIFCAKTLAIYGENL